MTTDGATQNIRHGTGSDVLAYLRGRDSVATHQIEWEQVYKGPRTQAVKLKKDYKDRGYHTRLRNHVSYYTLEVGEPKLYNWRDK